MEGNFNRHLGSKLRMRRLALGLTQTKVAQAINVTFQQIQKYEKGTNGISSLRLMQLSNFLRVPVVYFFEDFPAYSNSANTSNLEEDYNYELLLDSLWKACRFGVDAKISNFKNGIISIRNSIEDMINYTRDWLDHFGNLDIIETVEHVLNHGTEHDLQMEYFKKNNIDDLKIYLMETVDYNL